jgi:hypothetical protein
MGCIITTLPLRVRPPGGGGTAGWAAATETRTVETSKARKTGMAIIRKAALVEKRQKA